MRKLPQSPSLPPQHTAFQQVRHTTLALEKQGSTKSLAGGFYIDIAEAVTPRHAALHNTELVLLGRNAADTVTQAVGLSSCPLVGAIM